MKKVLNTIQKLLSYSMVLLSAFAVYTDRVGIAIYLMLAALYTADMTIIVSNYEEVEE